MGRQPLCSQKEPSIRLPLGREKGFCVFFPLPRRPSFSWLANKANSPSQYPQQNSLCPPNPPNPPAQNSHPAQGFRQRPQGFQMEKSNFLVKRGFLLDQLGFGTLTTPFGFLDGRNRRGITPLRVFPNSLFCHGALHEEPPTNVEALPQRRAPGWDARSRSITSAIYRPSSPPTSGCENPGVSHASGFHGRHSQVFSMAQGAT